MFFAKTHYRSPPDFNEKALTDIKKGLEKIYRLKEKLEELSKTAKVKKIDEKKLTSEEKKYLSTIDEFKEQFEQAMDDDFNTPKAFAVLFEFVNKSNRYLEDSPSEALCAHALETLLKLGNILTLFQPKTTKISEPDDSILVKKLQKIVQQYEKDFNKERVEELLKAILNAREKARKEKDWKTADKIRKELEDIGFEIQDTDAGPVWRKK
jgi:cysteinyl-tRNA synthetase